MSRKRIFLMNPISGTKDKAMAKEVLRRKMEEKGLAFELFPTNATGDYASLEKKIREEGIEDIIVIGGDGTISQVANALRHLPVHFGLIPMGSGNGLALTAGIPKDPAKALEIALNGQPSRIDAFLINGHFSCMLSGIGFDAKVAHDFSKMKKRGFQTYMTLSARNFFAARPYPFTITMDGQKTDTRAYLVSIANSNQFGNQFTIAPKARLNDGLLDIVIIRKMNKLQVLLSVFYQVRFGDIRENIFSPKGIIYRQARELAIENPSLAPLHIDGDPYETSAKFTVKVIPGAFSLIQPA